MNDRAALVQAICAAPDDDAPRLVFADWLEEHGETDRAEIIRVQCALAQLEAEDSPSQAVYAAVGSNTEHDVDWSIVDPGVSLRLTLQARAAMLLKKHQKAWKAAEAPAKCGITWDQMQRGFFAAGTLRGARTFASSYIEPLQRAPLRHLDCWDFDTQAPFLIRSGGVKRINSLSVHGAGQRAGGVAGIRAFSDCPDTSHIRAFGCHYSYATMPIALALAGSEHWRNLRMLDLRDAGSLGPAGAEELFRARHLRNLTKLTIWGSKWTPRTVRALTESGFKQLRELVLFQCDLNDEAAELLAGCADFRHLHTLDLTTSRITGRGVSALLASPYLKNLVVLNLHQNPVRQFNAAQLAKQRQSALRVLIFGNSGRLVDDDLAALAGSAAGRGLYWLTADGCRVSDRALERMAEAGGFPKLCSLNLLYNQLGDRGADVVANCPSLANLQALHLNGNDFGIAGARHLAASPHLNQLRHLCIGGDHLRAEGKRLLKKRFGKAVKIL